MKILLAVPGHLKTVPMSAFSEKALMSLGHEVVFFDYHENIIDKIKRKINPKGQKYLGVNRRLKQLIDQYKPDLLFTIYGFNINKDALEYAKKQGVITACWWINDPFQYERGLKSAANYDFWFSNSSQCAKDIESTTGTKSAFLPVAIDPDTHMPVSAQNQYRSDVCFAGDWSQDREEVVLSLINAGIDIKIYGPWHKKIAKDSVIHQYLVPGFFTPAQMASYFCSSRLVLNYHTWYGRYEHGINPRLFEASGCGVAQVVDNKLEIKSLYEPDDEVIVYQRVDELPELIQRVLKRPDYLEAVGKAALEKTLSKHTYEIRMQEMLAFIFDGGRNE